MEFLSRILDSSHQRERFSSGTEMLDEYLKKQASQDIKRKLAVCFVWEKDSEIIGYYTLSNASIPLNQIPGDFRKKLPRSYLNLPCILIGRFAIDKAYHSKGRGKFLLIDALKRCFHSSKSIGSFAIIVDPIDENAQDFYAHFGFILLPDSGKMFLPMKTVQKLFG